MNQIRVYQKSASTGKTKVWAVEVQDCGDHAILRTSNGLLGGKIVDNETIITKGKGKNTIYEQACSEAQSKLNSKLRKGYTTALDVDQDSSTLGSGCPQPMLAAKYDAALKQSGSKNLEKFKLLNEKAIIQRKFDGVRRLIHVTKDKVDLYTRKGDLVNSLPHIAEQVHNNFLKIYDYVNRKYGVTEYWLDGEAYTDELTFNELNGLVRKEAKTQEDKDKVQHIEIRLYDVILPVCYSTRMKILDYFESKHVHVVESIEITLTDDNIKRYHDQFVKEGYEGLMIRQYGMGYDNKRSPQLIKVKIFEDAEFEIVGGEESVKKGMLGAFVVKMDVESTDRDGKEIVTFKAKPVGTHQELQNYWSDLDKLIGTKVTIEYFGRSEYNVPRFPVAKSLRYDL